MFMDMKWIEENLNWLPLGECQQRVVLCVLKLIQSEFVPGGRNPFYDYFETLFFYDENLPFGRTCALKMGNFYNWYLIPHDLLESCVRASECATTLRQNLGGNLRKLNEMEINAIISSDDASRGSVDMEVKLRKQLIRTTISPWSERKMQIQFTPHTFGIDYDLWLENKKRKQILRKTDKKQRLLMRDIVQKKSLTTEKVLSFCVYYLNPLTATICLCKHTQHWADWRWQRDERQHIVKTRNMREEKRIRHGVENLQRDDDVYMRMMLDDFHLKLILS